jgi:hypothetical protein
VIVESREPDVHRGDVFVERAAGLLILLNPTFDGVHQTGSFLLTLGDGVFGRRQFGQTPPGAVGGSVERLERDQ